MSYGIPGVPMLPPGGPSVGVPLELPRDVVRVGEQALWSTQKLDAVAQANQTYRLFSTPLGQSGQGFTTLTISETNIKEGGRIPAGLAFDTFGIASIIKASAALQPALADVQNIYSHSCLSWDFLATIIDVAPVALVGAGGGIFGVAAGNPAANDLPVLNNGSGGLFVYRRHPIALPANSTFNILLRFGGEAGTLSQATNFQVVLIGSYRQAVEIG